MARMCQPHWDRLKAAVDAQGLKQFAATDQAELQRRMAAAADPKASFEPYLLAHNLIMGNAIEVCGIGVLNDESPEKPTCFLCFVRDTCKCGAPDCAQRYEDWVLHAARGVRKYAEEIGLVAAA